LLRTTYYRQDVDLTVAVSSGGKDVRKQLWNDLTIGTDDNLANKLGVWAAGSVKLKAPDCIVRVHRRGMGGVVRQRRGSVGDVDSGDSGVVLLI
jgi:hypothetical protein